MTQANPWIDAWMEGQKAIWDSALEMGKRAGNPEESAEPGAAAQKWWEEAAKVLGTDQLDLTKRAIDVNQSFYEFGQMVWNMARETQEAGESWRTAIEENLRKFKEAMQIGSSDTTDAWSSYAGAWGMNGDAWSDFMRSLGQSPVHAEGLAGINAGDAMSKMLQLPALGYHRESQEKLQQWSALAGEYAKAAQTYASLLNEANGKSVDLLGRRLVELTQKEEAPTTLRGMYDLWVDCGEEVYAELAEEERYLTAQGDMFNALMRMKRQEQEMTQDLLSSLNIPGRRELDTALCRLHDTRKALGELQDLVEESCIEEMRAEIADLRSTVAELKGEAAKKPKAVPARKKAAKKATAKKS